MIKIFNFITLKFEFKINDSLYLINNYFSIKNNQNARLFLSGNVKILQTFIKPAIYIDFEY